MDSLEQAMAYNSSPDNKDGLLLALLKYVMRLLDNKPEDDETEYNKKYGPKMRDTSKLVIFPK